MFIVNEVFKKKTLLRILAHTFLTDFDNIQFFIGREREREREKERVRDRDRKMKVCA